MAWFVWRELVAAFNEGLRLYFRPWMFPQVFKEGPDRGGRNLHHKR